MDSCFFMSIFSGHQVMLSIVYEHKWSNVMYSSRNTAFPKTWLNDWGPFFENAFLIRSGWDDESKTQPTMVCGEGRLEKKTVVKKQTNVVRTTINHPANHHKEVV
jgi:hypothetical protein